MAYGQDACTKDQLYGDKMRVQRTNLYGDKMHIYTQRINVLGHQMYP